MNAAELDRATEPERAGGGPAPARYDFIWTAVPIAALIYLGVLVLRNDDPRLMWQGARVAGLASVIALAAFGGMTLALGVLWIADLRLAAPPRRPGMASYMAGGLLTAVLGAALLPIQSTFPMAQVGPWLYLCGVLMVLLLALFKEGSVSRPGGVSASRDAAAVARDYLTLTKPGLNGLVLATAFVGYLMASAGPVDWPRCAWLMLGLAMAAGGSSTLNQVCEVEFDKHMRRTASRPVPAGRIQPAHALAFGILLSSGGLVVVAKGVGLAAAAVAALTLAVYVFLYTPLKRINTLSTLAGAIAGALPPLAGWVAAGGRVGAGGMILFFILFFWQIPHFLAIAWKYREQYAAADYPMYSVLDASGRAVSAQSLLHGAALVAVTLLAVPLGMAGAWYGVAAALLGGALMLYAVQFRRRPDPASARALFFATLIYLPLLLGAMTLDRLPLAP